MLGENHFNRFERDGSLDSTSVRRHESIASNNLDERGKNPYSDHIVSNVRSSVDYGQNSEDMSSQTEINKLSSELNSRISREIDEMMSGGSSQIQRAINDAISNQVLPQIQVIMAGSGRETRRGWETFVERPEINPEDQRSVNVKTNLRNEHSDDHRHSEITNRNVHDMVTGDNKSPNQVPEFLTGRILSRSHLNQSYEDINLDTTIPAQERIATTADLDPITRLAAITLIVQMKINHFYSLLRKNALQTFRNINSTNRQTLEDVLVIFRRKYVKPQSQATAKHKWH